MTLVAGVDSSTQACKVVVRDADTGVVTHHHEELSGLTVCTGPTGVAGGSFG